MVYKAKATINARKRDESRPGEAQPPASRVRYCSCTRRKITRRESQKARCEQRVGRFDTPLSCLGWGRNGLSCETNRFGTPKEDVTFYGERPQAN